MSLGERSLAVLAYARDVAEGFFSADLADHLGSDTSSVSKVLQRLAKLDLLRYVEEKSSGAPTRFRYYLPEHETTALQMHEDMRGLTWGQVVAPVVVREKYQGKPALTRDQARVLPPSEPVFSKLRPGQYIDNDTAIARRYK